MNRRSFIQRALTITGLIAVLPSILNAEERRRGGGSAAAAAPGLTLADPKGAQESALSYAVSHADVKDKALQTEKSGVKWVDQKCQTCAFYVKDKEATIGGKKAAPCQLLPNKAVLPTAWCNSWAKKA